MFVHAIEVAAAFTRPIHIAVRYYGSTDIHPGAATLFFINPEGWALTCRHVALHIATTEDIAKRRTAFRKELQSAPATANPRKVRTKLEHKHGFGPATPFEIRNNFVNCVEGPLQAQIILHPNPAIDAALIRFENFTRLGPTSFPVFAKEGAGLKQGKFLCRLGFPFPEFTNFTFDSTADEIKWTTSGRQDTPRFPIEGMLTRHLIGDGGRLIGFELSTPGLRGQSGGPAFDTDGRVWGMQSATTHLDLDFDVNQEVVRSGKKKRVTDSAFLHVGRCVDVTTLKSFMTDHGVSFAAA